MRGFVGRFVAAATMGALAAPVLADAPAYEEYEGMFSDSQRVATKWGA